MSKIEKSGERGTSSTTTNRRDRWWCHQVYGVEVWWSREIGMVEGKKKER